MNLTYHCLKSLVVPSLSACALVMSMGLAQAWNPGGSTANVCHQQCVARAGYMQFNNYSDPLGACMQTCESQQNGSQISDRVARIRELGFLCLKTCNNPRTCVETCEQQAIEQVDRENR